jgi:hypothetical protein
MCEALLPRRCCRVCLGASAERHDALASRHRTNYTCKAICRRPGCVCSVCLHSVATLYQVFSKLFAVVLPAPCRAACCCLQCAPGAPPSACCRNGFVVLPVSPCCTNTGFPRRGQPCCNPQTGVPLKGPCCAQDGAVLRGTVCRWACSYKSPQLNLQTLFQPGCHVLHFDPVNGATAGTRQYADSSSNRAPSCLGSLQQRIMRRRRMSDTAMCRAGVRYCLVTLQKCAMGPPATVRQMQSPLPTRRAGG